MGIVVDLIIVILLLVFIIGGYKRGLTGSMIKLLSFAIALVLAVIFYKPVANIIINTTTIDDNIKTSIVTSFTNKQTESSDQKNTTVPEAIIDSMDKDIKDATTNAENAVVEDSANRVTTSIINIIAGIAIFIIARIILLIVSVLIKGITQLPIIKQVDKIGGLAYGFLEGFLIIYICLGILSFATILFPKNIIAEAVNKSAIGNTLYNNNIILKTFIK